MISIRRANGAFTLIELLFIVAVISVLAAISVPNFLEAQTRSKIARVQVDLASIGVGLNRYYADNGTYPPNDPGVRQYLDAAMINPVMDSDNTTAPDDATVPWYRMQSALDGTTNPQQMLFEEYFQDDQYGYVNRVDFPALLINGRRQLALLTTPVSYLGTRLPDDAFAYRRKDPFTYINSAELFASETTGPLRGLWGDHLTSETQFLVSSTGPDTEDNIWHPLSGPWVEYNPTNGTMSAGDFFKIEGRRPGYREPKKEHLPNFAEEDLYGMGWGEF